MRKGKPLILIVEDTVMNIKILGNILKKRGYQIAIAGNGQKALNFVKKKLPDLILLDIMMPGIDGYEVCGRLQNNAKTSDIPIIFISALHGIENKLQGFKQGAVDYITKPFQEEEVLARVKTHLELKLSKERLLEDNYWFKTLFENATEPIIMFDDQYRIVDINDKFSETFKYSLGEIQTRKIDQVIKTENADILNTKIGKGLMSGQQMELQERHYDKYGEAVDCLIRGIPVVIAGKLVGGFIQFVDITEMIKKEAKIRYISFHDQMTGLYNRRYFENEIDRMNKTRRLPVSLIVADMDELKQINDNYGHLEGDRFIIMAAEIIKSVTRADDIVARIGGDEFAVILPETGKKVASSIVDRIDKKCRQRNKNLKIQISISAGFAIKQREEQDLREILQKADRNMYKSKRRKLQDCSNRNGV